MEIIGHRGFAAIAPENTMISFLYALEKGAHSLEFDLQLSADGVPVIFHDERLDRLTKTPGKIREKTLLELQNLDVGAWFGPEFIGQHIPNRGFTSIKAS
jgi:glycerophosphoryl diester phosphodiesterase